MGRHGCTDPLHSHQQSNPHHKASAGFLPKLCSRPSLLRDVSLPRLKHLEPPSTTLFSDDPLSPKISCIGQVKRSNKITAFPSLTSNHTKSSVINTSMITANTQNDTNTYSKLKRLFSYQSPPTTTTTTSRSATPRRKVTRGLSSLDRSIKASNGGPARTTAAKKVRCGSADDENGSRGVINIADLDPPLPVVKRVGKSNSNGTQGDDHQSLWKRRSGGATLRSLQVQPHRVQLETNTV